MERMEYDNASLTELGEDKMTSPGLVSLTQVTFSVTLFSAMMTLSALTTAGNSLVLYAVRVNPRLQTVCHTTSGQGRS
jgi:hypothetical protein